MALHEMRRLSAATAQATCREATRGDEGQRQTQRLWTPVLDPPAALSWLSVVLVGVKRPYSAGSVARASNCFECEDLRLVQVGPLSCHVCVAKCMIGLPGIPSLGSFEALFVEQNSGCKLAHVLGH